MNTTHDAETGRELIPAPTEAGWYVYHNEDVMNNGMIFHLRYVDGEPRWSVHFDNGDSGDCVWSYIEQGLGASNLVPLVPKAM